jgi:hypothetical protein
MSPFPKKIVHVIVFCDDVYAPSKLISINPKHTFTSLVAYCTTFDMAWPKQELTNGHGN